MVRRRRIVEQPISRLAIWTWRLAMFALAATILSALIVRADLLELVPALAAFAGALALAVIAVLVGLAALAAIWNAGLAGLGSAVAGIAVGLAIVAYPAYLAAKAYRLPAIYDVTTDTDDPPKFEALARIRPRQGANPVEYGGTRVADLQHAAYPDVDPLVVAVPPLVAYNTVYSVMVKRKWRIVEARRPSLDGREGHIEAVARTPILGFRDDVVVRLRQDTDGTRVDVRSESRYGRHDIGTNAARITAFLDDVEAAIDALPDTKREPEQAPEAKPPQAARQPQASRRPAAKR